MEERRDRVAKQPTAPLKLPPAQEERREHLAERTELRPALRLVYQTPAQKKAAQRNHKDKQAVSLEELEAPTEKIPVYRPDLWEADPEQTLSGGKTR
jgi:hypothetical protein